MCDILVPSVILLVIRDNRRKHPSSVYDFGQDLNFLDILVLALCDQTI